MTAAIVAATHPAADVHAVDAMPQHVAHARNFYAEAGIDNLSLHDASFGAPELDALPQFDYIVLHGVYSWIGAQPRSDMLQFIGGHLRPGGLVYVSYNAMPGWAADLPTQRLLQELAARADGDSNARFATASAILQRMTDAGARALRASPLASSELEERRKTSPVAYFAHEYLPTAWQAYYVTDVRQTLARFGLQPIASATLRDNFDSYTIAQRGRDALTAIADANLRELLRDYFRGTRFRRDVFGRSVPGLDDGERRARLLATTYHLAAPPESVSYRMTTAAGEVRFDTPIARRIVDALATGPKRLTDLGGPQVESQDLLANAVALCAANAVRPASPQRAMVTRANAVLDGRTGAEAFPYRVSPFGTAVYVGPKAPDSAAEDAPAAERTAAWDRFLCAYGMDVPSRQ